MTVTASWHLPGRILHTTGAVTLEAFHVRDRLIVEALEREGRHPMVHVLLDYTNVKPIDLEQYTKAVQQYYRTPSQAQGDSRLSQHPLLGLVISIDAPEIDFDPEEDPTRRVLSYPRLRCKTLDDALALLKERDNTLARSLRTQRR